MSFTYFFSQGIKNYYRSNAVVSVQCVCKLRYEYCSLLILSLQLQGIL